MAEIVRQQLTARPPIVPAQSFTPPRPPPKDMGLRMTTDPDVWRVREPELPELSRWLFGKLHDKYPRANDGGLVSMLQGAITTPSMYFVRSKNVTLLLESRTSGLEPAPIVQEVFMRIRAGQADPTDLRKAQYEEGFKCYRAGIAWSESIRACRMDIGFDTDLPVTSLYDADNSAKKRAYHSIPVRQK